MCRKGGRKTKQERKEVPMFQTVVEMHSHEEWHVYTNVAESVDALLAGKATPVQLRRHINGKMVITTQELASHGSDKKQTRRKAHSSWIDDLFHCSRGMLDSE